MADVGGIVLARRRLTSQYHRADEWYDDPDATGWVGYCPELDIEVRGDTQVAVTEAMNRRWGDASNEASRILNDALRSLADLGWQVQGGNRE